jgi:hypothetical protein
MSFSEKDACLSKNCEDIRLNNFIENNFIENNFIISSDLVFDNLNYNENFDLSHEKHSPIFIDDNKFISLIKYQFEKMENQNFDSISIIDNNNFLPFLNPKVINCINDNDSQKNNNNVFEKINKNDYLKLDKFNFNENNNENLNEVKFGLKKLPIKSNEDIKMKNVEIRPTFLSLSKNETPQILGKKNLKKNENKYINKNSLKNLINENKNKSINKMIAKKNENLEEEEEENQNSNSSERNKNIQISSIQPEKFKKFVKWSVEEDSALYELVSKNKGKNWKKISQIIKRRSPIQCFHRWSKILQPGLKKGPWRIEEDKILKNWVKVNGATKWTNCSKLIEGRNGKQCKERWFNTLNPKTKIGDWTIEEDFYIFFLYHHCKGKWTIFPSIIKGRTENSIKNRFYSTLRKKNNLIEKKENSNEKKKNYPLENIIKYLPLVYNEISENFKINANISNEELEILKQQILNKIFNIKKEKDQKEMQNKKKNEKSQIKNKDIKKISYNLNLDLNLLNNYNKTPNSKLNFLLNNENNNNLDHKNNKNNFSLSKETNPITFSLIDSNKKNSISSWKLDTNYIDDINFNFLKNDLSDFFSSEKNISENYDSNSYIYFIKLMIII